MSWLDHTLRNVSLRRKLRAVVLGTSLLTMVFVMVVYIAYEWFAANQQLQEELAARAQIIADNSSAALVFNDAAAATETLEALSRTPDVIRACAYRSGDASTAVLFARYQRESSTSTCPPQWVESAARDQSDSLQAVFPVQLNGASVGLILIESDLSKLWHRLQIVTWGSALVSIAVCLLALFLSRLVERTIAEPVMRLHGLMQQVASSDDYSLRALPAGEDEIGALIQGFNNMLARVELRDGELREAHSAVQGQVQERDQANAELHKALERLRSTQDQLVQSEKMASLGGLVAGVAHEINTPIGVAFTAASTLQSRSQDLSTAYAEGTMRRSTLDRYVQQAVEIGDMIVKNLSRAAELIQSFKQVAVDQTSGERRQFVLQGYIEETLQSLRPKLKKLPYSVEVHCDSELRLNAYPGAVSQILTNLILNSVIHGFEGRDSGHIRIEGSAEGDGVRLRYQDDGVGMSREARQRIFDPFFTTKRGQGGSGLGMHIVYNLVTRTLGGRITMPETSQGVVFDIHIPQEAPA